jgi:hypothetical protein
MSKTNRQVLDSVLYGKDTEELYEKTAEGLKNKVRVMDMLRTCLFQYDPKPRDGTLEAMDEVMSKLAYADDLLLKLGAEEVKIEEEDFNLLKALVLGMQFQAGNVRHQLLQHLEQLTIYKGRKPIPAKK